MVRRDNTGVKCIYLLIAAKRDGLANNRHRWQASDGGGPVSRGALGTAGSVGHVPQPAARLLVDHGPGWHVVRQHAPVGAGPHDIAQAIEDLAQRIAALPSILGQPHQVRRDEGPFLVADIGRVGSARA